MDNTSLHEFEEHLGNVENLDIDNLIPIGKLQLDISI